MRVFFNPFNRSNISAAFFVAAFLGFVSSSKAQCTLYAVDTVRLTLSADSCSVTVLPEMVLQAISQCPNPKKVEVLDPAGSPIPGSPVIGRNYLGAHLFAKVTDLVSGNNATSLVIVNDLTPPVLTCQTTSVYCNSPLTPDITGYPIYKDNCSQAVSLAYSDTRVDYTCNAQFAAKITRSWVAKDAQNNVSTCTQTINLKWIQMADIVFPKNYDGFERAAISCESSIDPNQTGAPLAFGYPVSNACLYSVFNEDQKIPLCGGSFKIIRSWTVFNSCSSELNFKVQVILANDKTPPQLSCPKDITVSTDKTSCTATLSLEPLKISDNCSSFSYQMTTTKGTYDAEKQTIAELPIGNHTISYFAKDSCGNGSTCSYSVTVVDSVPPVAICKNLYQLILNERGEASLSVNEVNQNSSDNCGIASVLIKRKENKCQTTAFPTDKIYFSCCDIGDTLSFDLIVKDSSGNTSTKTALVWVADFSSPTISCPKDITVQCGADLKDLTLTGAAQATDNCSVESDYTDFSEVNSCGNGVVKRNWLAKDKGNRIAACVQNIVVKNSNSYFINTANPIDSKDGVEWPKDTTVTGCGISVMPNAIGQPKIILTATGCGNVTYTYEDQLFADVLPTCYRILRKWTVTDWCQYTEGGTTGRWSYNQNIYVRNSEAPIISSTCKDTTYNVSVADCGPAVITLKLNAKDDCTPSGLLRWDCRIDRNNDGTTDVTGKSSTVKANFLAGSHRITWVVEDGCANVASCSYVITVKDGAKPVAKCKSDVSIFLQQNPNGGGSVTISPKDINDGSSDNCTNSTELNLYTNTQPFSCQHVGKQPVTLYVSDKSGNTDSCTTIITIADPNRFCQTVSIAEVKGTILTENGEPIGSVKVEATGMAPFTTLENGQFAFSNLSINNAYTFSPKKDINPTNGVSTQDLILINKHILNIQPLTSPYKIIAADANNDGRVTTSDMVELRKLILHATQSLRNSDSWRFISKNFTFTNPANPFLDVFPESISFSKLLTNQTLDFVGIKVGDVSGNATPNDLVQGEERNNSYTSLAISDIDMKKGQTYQIAFRLPEEAVEGLQMGLQVLPSKAKILKINTLQSEIKDHNFNTELIERGILLFSWNGQHTEQLFSIEVMAQEDVAFSEIISINDDYLVSEAYRKGEVKSEKLKLNFETKDTKFDLGQNTPNPFKGSTTISCSVSENCIAKVTILNQLGMVVESFESDLSSGTNLLTINANNQPSGTYYYKVETPFGSAVRKMVIVE